MKKSEYEEHMAHRKKVRVATDCTAHHVNFGGGCLNCGYVPNKNKTEVKSHDKTGSHKGI